METDVLSNDIGAILSEDYRNNIGSGSSLYIKVFWIFASKVFGVL